MADYTIKANDTFPPLRAVLADLGGPIDLTTADSVKVLLKSNSVSVEGVCDIDDADAGSISYTWATGDTENVGTYQGEFEITWDTGIVETVPNANYFSLIIVADLG